MNKIVVQPNIQIHKKIIFDTKGRSFEVCYAVFSVAGVFHTKILGARLCDEPKKLIEEKLALPGLVCESPYFPNIKAVQNFKQVFSSHYFFLTSQPTRAPNLC